MKSRRCAALGAAIGLTLGVLLVGCTPDPTPLMWTIAFESTDVRDTTAFVEATILEGGCDGSEIFRAEVSRESMSTPIPPTLAPDMTYGFSAVGIDARCREASRHCEEVTLPRTDPVVVAIRMNPSPFARCTASECNLGRCTGAPDSGVPTDAGMDATDASTDAAVDVASDVAADTSADAPVDTPGDAVVASCAGEPDGTLCGDGMCRAGACCSGCWDGAVCRTGRDSSRCGRGGERCSACDADCQTCDEGRCADRPAGTACGLGQCRGRPASCCEGCWTGTACTGGRLTSACGSGGEVCTVCGGVDLCCPDSPITCGNLTDCKL